jgi:hypothetical protein
MIVLHLPGCYCYGLKSTEAATKLWHLIARAACIASLIEALLHVVDAA